MRIQDHVQDSNLGHPGSRWTSPRPSSSSVSVTASKLDFSRCYVEMPYDNLPMSDESVVDFGKHRGLSFRQLRTRISTTAG